MLLQSSSIFFASSGSVEKSPDVTLSLRPPTTSTASFASPLYGLSRVKQHKATCAKRNEQHHDYGGNNRANMALLALTLAMAMTDQAIRGRARRSVAAIVQAKIVIIFLGTGALKLGTVVFQTGERAGLGGTGIDRAKVARKPRATGRGSIVGGIAGINVAGGIRGVGSAYVVRRCRRSPARLRRGVAPPAKTFPLARPVFLAF